jgi:hypothetical protein
MTDFSSLLQSLVDHPHAPPASIDSLLARGRRRRVRRVMGATGLSLAVVAAFGGVLALSGRGRSPTTIAVTGSGARSASYSATAAGGYQASGGWKLTVVRDGLSVVYSSATSPTCGALGTIRPGDRVFAEIESAESFVRAGEDAQCPNP